MGDYIDDTNIRAVTGDDWWHQATDRDQDGEPETVKINASISSAETEFDSYAGSSYPLDVLHALSPTPVVVVDCCVDLAIHALAQMDEGLMTDAIRRRYEDRIKWLILLAAGKVKIPLPADPDALGPGDAAQQTSNPRLFTRTTMARL